MKNQQKEKYAEEKGNRGDARRLRWRRNLTEGRIQRCTHWANPQTKNRFELHKISKFLLG